MSNKHNHVAERINDLRRKDRNKNSEEVLETLIIKINENLEDLSCFKMTEFIEGEMTAYIECLEIIQYWKYAEKNGLDFEIEKKYPLNPNEQI